MQRHLRRRLQVVGRWRRQPQVQRAQVAAVGGGGAAAGAIINFNTYKPKLSAMPKQFESTSREFGHIKSWLSSDARNHTKEAVSGACSMHLRIKDELELWYSNQGGLSDAGWGILSEPQKVTKWITERCSKAQRFGLRQRGLQRSQELPTGSKHHGFRISGRDKAEDRGGCS